MADPVPFCVVSPYLLVAQAVAAGLRSVGRLAEACRWDEAVVERDPYDRDPALPSRLVAVLEGIEDRDVVEQIDRIVRGGVVHVMVVTSEPPPVVWGALLETEAVDVVTSVSSVVELAERVERFVAGRSSMDAEGRLALQNAWRVADTRRQRLVGLLATLSPQQRRVLDLLASGRRVDEVGEVIGVARGTVRSHVKAMRAKLGARTQLEAVAMLNEVIEEIGGVSVPRPRQEWRRPGGDDHWRGDLIDPGDLGDDALAVWAVERVGSVLLDVRAAAETDRLDGHALEHAGSSAARAELIRVLTEHRPDDPVVLEESAADTARPTGPRVWLVAPLDGSTEFAETPRDDWTVNVALWDGGEVVASAVAQPALAETFSTARPGVPASATPARPRIAVSRSRPPAVVEALANAVEGELVPMGSAGAKVLSVVRGVADAYVDADGKHHWEYAAPVAVARAAGLHCSRFDGSPLVHEVTSALVDLVVCRPDLAEAIIGFVRRHAADPT